MVKVLVFQKLKLSRSQGFMPWLASREGSPTRDFWKNPKILFLIPKKEN
jgi:hypothetical protein